MGMACPGPLMKLSTEVNKLQPGQTIVVTASDPGFANDCQAFSKVAGLQMLSLTKDKGVICATMRKAGGAIDSGSTTSGNAMTSGPPSLTAAAGAATQAAHRDGASIICFSSEMDKVLAALVIANGACSLAKAVSPARQSKPVTIFFTFWGLNVLKKSNVSSIWHNLAAKDKSFMDRMFSMLMESGYKNLPLSRMNFGGIGRPLMEMQMQSKHLPTLDGLLKGARECGVRLLACTMSMEAMGVKPEDLIEGVEFGGVADFLASARETDLNLFI